MRLCGMASHWGHASYVSPGLHTWGYKTHANQRHYGSDTDEQNSVRFTQETGDVDVPCCKACFYSIQDERVDDVVHPVRDFALLGISARTCAAGRDDSR